MLPHVEFLVVVQSNCKICFFFFLREHEHHFEELSWCDTGYIGLTMQKKSRNSLSDPLHRHCELDDGIWQCVKTNSTPVVHIKIAGKWMFIPLKIVSIGFDPYPFLFTGTLKWFSWQKPCFFPWNWGFSQQDQSPFHSQGYETVGVQAFSPAGVHHPQLDLNLLQPVLGSEIFAKIDSFFRSLELRSPTKNTKQIL